MKERKEKPMAMEFSMTFDTKEDLRKFVESFGKIIGADQKKALNELVKEQIDEEETEELFCPKAGDILALTVGDDDCPNAIFQYNGTSHEDEDLDTWLHADVSVSFSGDLMKPYMILRGEDQDFLFDSCRHATEEECNLFYSKTEEKPEEEKDSPWNVGELVFVAAADSGCSNVFYPFPVSYADTKKMGNRAKRGWIFKSGKECQALCDKLNEAIKSIKP